MQLNLPIPSVRLIEQLSKNTYSSFKVGLKEFVINSFDAAATEVFVEIDPRTRSIRVADNGTGMSADEVVALFLKAGSTSKDSKTNINRRPVLGYKGIGVFSIFFFAAELVIETRQNEVSTKCIVGLATLRESDLESGMNDIDCLSWIQDYERPAQGTTITINGIDESSFRNIWNEQSSLENQELFAYFSDVLPVQYREEDQGMTKSTVLLEEQKQLIEWNFTVHINGEQLFRHSPYWYFQISSLEDDVYKTEIDTSILDGTIGIKAVLFGGTKKIKDPRFIGIVLRNNNVAIGHRKENLFDMRSRVHMLQWLSGELLISGNINDAITSERERLIEDSQLFLELKDLLYQVITPFLNELQDRLVEGKRRKDVIQAEKDSETFKKTINRFLVEKGGTKEVTFVADKVDQIFSANEGKIEINTSSKAYGEFSNWADRELFYSFLALINSHLAAAGDDGCKKLFLSVQSEFNEYLNSRTRLKADENDFGF